MRDIHPSLIPCFCATFKVRRWLRYPDVWIRVTVVCGGKEILSTILGNSPIEGRHLFAEFGFSSVTRMPNSAHLDVCSNNF